MAMHLHRPSTSWSTVLFFLVVSQAGQILAQSGDGGGASGVEPGDIGGGAPGTGSQNVGAQGSDTGSVKLSVGATVAIAVVVSVVVLLGGTTAILFFLAKKRQWKIKEGLRRSASKVKSAVKAVTTPITPKRMTFSPIERRNNRAARVQQMRKHQHAAPEGLGIKADVSGQGERDLGLDVEKGVPSSAVAVVSGGGGEHDSKAKEGQKTESKSDSTRGKDKPRPPKVEIPPSAFEMDSPKTPMWKKVFGR
ncbi:hypothetical protein LTS15_010655 [Exophiala xenobiotica]|nr:hypothetical protein LTS15_010655 [Exophiala xenobiotica]